MIVLAASGVIGCPAWTESSESPTEAAPDEDSLPIRHPRIPRKVHVPPGDLLIHAGDFTMFRRSRPEILDFNVWLGELPHRYKIVIPGNHEFAFEEVPRMSREISNAVFLINEAVEVDAFRVWGSPVTTLYGGAFGRSAATDRARIYSEIPKGTDILVTHGPPFGALDRPRGTDRNDGCRQLLAAVRRIRPRLHIFGHIHSGYGTHRANGTVFVNAALCGESRAIEQQPSVIDLDPRQLRGLRKHL